MKSNRKSLSGDNAPKLRPFFALLFTTLMSVLLISQRKVRSTGTFHHAVTSDPATAAFVKQIIASLLGAIWIYAAGSIFNLTTRLRLASLERTPSLQAVNVWAAVGSQRVDFSLPVHYSTLTLTVVLAGHAIGSIWGGAIAPISLPTNLSGVDSLGVPRFTPPWFTQQFPDDGDDANFNDNVGDQCQTYNGIYGFIPACPVPGLQNLVLASASSATTYDGEPRTHSKNDNPMWSYSGRSYGVGSSQGLQGILPLSATDGDLLGYNYTETGYLVDTFCSYNTTSAFILSQVIFDYQPANGSDVLLNIFVANGTLPNANDDADFISYPLVSENSTYGGGPDLLTWAANSKHGANMISVVGYGAYEAYDTMQCSVNFTQTQFQVQINVTNSTIIVSPGQMNQDDSFDGNHHLKSNTMASLSLLAQTASSVAFNTLGESLTNNWLTYNQSIDKIHVSYDPNQEFIGNDSSILLAAEDSFNAMLDDILVGYGAAQLFWGESRTGLNVSITVPVTSTYNSTRLGQDGYIFATLAINLVLIMIGVEEAIRTRNWKQMPRLDYLDLKSVIVAASAGGKGVWEDCNHRHPEGIKWDGNSSSKEVAAIRVRLGQGSVNSPGAHPVIMLAQTVKDEDVADGISEDGIPLRGWHSEH